MNIPKELHGINSDLEKAVACFRPVLQKLDIRNTSSIGVPVLLCSTSFPNLRKVKNISKWTITILRTDLIDSKAKFVSQYDKSTGIMENYIILNDVLYVDTKAVKETRKAVVVHEFCHFLTLIYACLSTPAEGTLHDILQKRLSKIVGVLTNEQTLKLYQLLNQVRQLGNDFASFEQTKDDHFRLYCEDLELSYTDIFRHFLLSHQLFDDFFITAEKETFYTLLQRGQTQNALDLYLGIAKSIAEKKWLSEKFAVNQAIDILMKFYIHRGRDYSLPIGNESKNIPVLDKNFIGVGEMNFMLNTEQNIVHYMVDKTVSGNFEATLLEFGLVSWSKTEDDVIKSLVIQTCSHILATIKRTGINEFVWDAVNQVMGDYWKCYRSFENLLNCDVNYLDIKKQLETDMVLNNTKDKNGNHFSLSFLSVIYQKMENIA